MYSWRYACWMPCWSGSSGLRGWLAARQAEEEAGQVDGVVGQVGEGLVAGEVEVEVEVELQAVGGLTQWCFWRLKMTWMTLILME